MLHHYFKYTPQYNINCGVYLLYVFKYLYSITLGFPIWNFLMSKTEKIDFNFRYRPVADSPDGILFGYLQSIPPRKRKFMILKALRAFYLISAYGSTCDLDSPAELAEFANQVQKIYGEDYDELESFFVKLELKIKNTGDWTKYETLDYDPES